MAIYGIGAMFGGTEDMTEVFLEQCGAYLGWTVKEAPFAHQMLRRITVGDLIFIKSYPPTVGLQVKAVGIVTDPADEFPDWDLGTRVGVQWWWQTGPRAKPLVIGKLDDKADFMRRGSLYEELNPQVQRQILDLILR